MRTGKSFVAVSGNPWIRVYPLEQLNKSPVVYRGHSGNVVSTDFQQDEKWFISCCEDGFIRVWDLRCTGYQSSQKHQSPINPPSLDHRSTISQPSVSLCREGLERWNYCQLGAFSQRFLQPRGFQTTRPNFQMRLQASKVHSSAFKKRL